MQLAQWAASRADLFPALLCERMGALHSRGKAHSLAHTKNVIEQVFQRPFEDVFEQFDETPIGTGAIAQVCCWPCLHIFFLTFRGAVGLPGDPEARSYSPISSDPEAQ